LISGLLRRRSSFGNLGVTARLQAARFAEVAALGGSLALGYATRSLVATRRDGRLKLHDEFLKGRSSHAPTGRLPKARQIYVGKILVRVRRGSRSPDPPRAHESTRVRAKVHLIFPPSLMPVESDLFHRALASKQRTRTAKAGACSGPAEPQRPRGSAQKRSASRRALYGICHSPATHVILVVLVSRAAGWVGSRTKPKQS
jgi:hypothetical protein